MNKDKIFEFLMAKNTMWIGLGIIALSIVVNAITHSSKISDPMVIIGCIIFFAYIGINNWMKNKDTPVSSNIVDMEVVKSGR